MLLTFTYVIFYATLSGQGVFSNKTQAVLEKVIQDYPNRFYNIKGELIHQTRLTTEYRSTLQLPGSSSVITRTNAISNEDYSWVCAVFEAPGFEQAKAKFLEIYGQISNSIITTAGQKTFILTGQYEDPLEQKKCTHIIFSLLPGVGDAKKLKVQLTLRKEAKGWRIALSVYDHDPKEEMEGAVTSN
jgi:hypothetical protein